MAADDAMATCTISTSLTAAAESLAVACTGDLLSSVRTAIGEEAVRSTTGTGTAGASARFAGGDDSQRGRLGRGDEDEAVEEAFDEAATEPPVGVCTN